jgi:hypothetical protein
VRRGYYSFKHHDLLSLCESVPIADSSPASMCSA